MLQTENITFEMIENLQYDQINKLTSVNLFKLLGDCAEVKINPVSDEIITDFVKAVKQNITKLAFIEEENNCVPRKVVERYIDLALKSNSYAETCALDGVKGLHDVCSERTLSLDHTSVATWNISPFHFIRDMITGLILHKEVKIIYDQSRYAFIKQLLDLLKIESFNTVNVASNNNVVDAGDMFILESSDLEAASHYLIRSIYDYIGSPWKCRTIYVQESCMKKFVTKVLGKLHPYPAEIIRDKHFQECYRHCCDRIKELNARTLDLPEEKSYTPLICFEFDKNYFKDPLQIVIVIRSFRTAKELINLAQKNPLSYSTIWSTNISVAYEIIKKLDREIFWINCYDIWGHLWNKLDYKHNESAVSVEGSYHYEYFSSNEKIKKVVFPIGGTFAN